MNELLAKIVVGWWSLQLWPYRLIVMPIRYQDFRWWKPHYWRLVKMWNDPDYDGDGTEYEGDFK